MPRSIVAVCRAAEQPRADDRTLTFSERMRWLGECRRLRRNYHIERSLGAPRAFVAGVDEAGRGPLAGPVVAAAVILPLGCLVPGLNDSKRLPPARREDLYGKIVRRAVSLGAAGVSAMDIDDIGIKAATLRAMARAVARLHPGPSAIIVDGREPVPELVLRQRTVVRGDQKSNSVAAASIVAKVIRDRIMRRHHRDYPEYSFRTNVGYGTPAHRQALRAHGPTPVHRTSFLGHLGIRQLDLFRRD